MARNDKPKSEPESTPIPVLDDSDRTAPEPKKTPSKSPTKKKKAPSKKAAPKSKSEPKKVVTEKCEECKGTGLPQNLSRYEQTEMCKNCDGSGSVKVNKKGDK